MAAAVDLLDQWFAFFGVLERLDDDPLDASVCDLPGDAGPPPATWEPGPGPRDGWACQVLRSGPMPPVSSTVFV
ncbi:hypothetical protein GCM10010347_42110 [Streptomyces cirratus]|uniref:Uncharacterized protein n=1 Tax=Streptomyces cirratus TaxID=68187 RepID=A0ABQ3F0K0_9ACTN|nr:hypothetical protein [Streptomyces cirratus]GHB67592.1 hypothetical protein GCM10010347_42110 [Streptomyces cirratus]